MRKEPFSVGSVVHVLKRGARGLPITHDDADRYRFMRLLCHFNDAYKDDFWEENTQSLSMFERPAHWPPKNELVKIHAWVLMPNHFHLILEEIQEGGIAKFMQKVCGSMSTHYNKKYKEKGSLFQGAYKSRTAGRDNYIQYLVPYILVKNVFELYPEGFSKAIQEFDKAWEWSKTQYAFSSLPEYLGVRGYPITHANSLDDFIDPGAFYGLAKDMVLSKDKKEYLKFDFLE